MAKHGWCWLESSPLSCIVSGVRESRSAGRSTQEPPDSIVRKSHPSKIADVMVARRARVRVAARVGLERRHCMPARCGHCSTCAPDQMLRRIIPTAERTVTWGGDKKPSTNEKRFENAWEPFLRLKRKVVIHLIGPVALVMIVRQLNVRGAKDPTPFVRRQCLIGAFDALAQFHV